MFSASALRPEEKDMSWDIFVQDIPAGVTSVREIPDDFEPGSLGPRAEIFEGIRTALPFADYSDGSWIRVDLPEVSMEISLGKDDPVQGFTFHVRGGYLAAAAIADVLRQLGVRAFDPEADNGLFDMATAGVSLQRWQEFRDAVLHSRTTLRNAR
jgi:hypothetical protein